MKSQLPPLTVAGLRGGRGTGPRPRPSPLPWRQEASGDLQHWPGPLDTPPFLLTAKGSESGNWKSKADCCNCDQGQGHATAQQEHSRKRRGLLGPEKPLSTTGQCLPPTGGGRGGHRPTPSRASPAPTGMGGTTDNPGGPRSPASGCSLGRLCGEGSEANRSWKLWAGPRLPGPSQVSPSDSADSHGKRAGPASGQSPQLDGGPRPGQGAARPSPRGAHLAFWPLWCSRHLTAGRSSGAQHQGGCAPAEEERTGVLRPLPRAHPGGGPHLVVLRPQPRGPHPGGGPHLVVLRPRPRR